MPTVVHPFLRPGVEARGYQIRALQSALSSSTLMVMPTGFGKTAVEWMVMAEFLKQTDKKIVLIAPTTGLVAQQQRMARDMINIDPELIMRYTGETPPEKRSKIWDDGKILMATPQVIRNDAASGRISLLEVSLIIFDEAHHATGNHAYAQVGDLYLNQNPDGYSLAATASPGTTKSAILEVAKRLGIDIFDVSLKDEALLKPYAVTLNNDEISIELPEALQTLIYPLQEHQANEVESIQRMGFMAPVKNVTSRIITEAQMAASRAIKRRDPRGYGAAKKISDIRRMHMLLDLVKTQGVKAALAFLDKAEDDGRTGERVTNRFLALPVVHNFRINARNLGEIHPKAQVVENMVSRTINQNPSSKILIFTEYRYTVSNLIESLAKIKSVNASQFIGQSTSGKQKGMSQKQQLARLEEFRNGDINVLVATSVGEEGLDVPAADLVLMYEPVPSAIRSIQRRGRTARQRPGTVKTLVAVGTRDQFVSRAAKAKERKMHNNLRDIERQKRFNFRTNIMASNLDSFSVKIGEEISPSAKFLQSEIDRLNALYPSNQSKQDPEQQKSIPAQQKPKMVAAKDMRPRNQTGLDDFVIKQEKITAKENQDSAINATSELIDSITHQITASITLDYREASSTLSAYIASLGLNVEYQNLPTGDMMINNEILVERKTSRDLLTSIIDNRLFKQCQRMRKSELQPLLLIELGEVGNSLHPNAVLGALAHVTLDLGVPIITTKDSMESAYLVYLIAQKYQNLSSHIRNYIQYNPVDENLVEGLCAAASIEISNMVNKQADSENLVDRWSNSASKKQAELLSLMTNIGVDICSGLISKHGSIAGVFRAGLDLLADDLDEENLRKMTKLY
ncbi:MAG: ERCC4 domain-containing protein [Candidatus Thermoplasmatota archaeon]|nr:ERCC4 domain-containing protein [Candidatus Thermoplasmatota archaeon]